METYLQTAWGDQWDNVDMDIVRTAIKGTKEMDDEHGAFWVGLVKDEENVLEVHKDLELIGVFEDNQVFSTKDSQKIGTKLRRYSRHYFRTKLRY